MDSPFKPFDGETADRIAEERTRKQAQKYPLLAFGALLEETTGAQIRDASEAHAERWNKLQEELEERATAFRAQVTALVSPEELAVMEQRLTILPDCPGYRADHWRRMLKEVQSRHDTGRRDQ